jgi:polyisoprenoid-binding protein YceI
MATAPQIAGHIAAGTWIVDPVHSTIGFAVRHAGVANVRGLFREFEGTIAVAADGTLSGGGSVALASVDTGAPDRDAHLRSADFFDVERHPELRFRATRIEVDGEDVTVAGELSLHGVTGTLELSGELTGPGIDDEGNTRFGLSLAGQLSRAAYGMRFNQLLGGGNVLVGDKVKLALEVSLIHSP